MRPPRLATWGLRWRLVALITLLLGASALVLTLLTLRAERRLMANELRERAGLLTSLVAANAVDPLATLDVRALRSLLADALEQTDVLEVMAFDDELRVLTDGTLDNPNRHRLLAEDLRERVLAADGLFLEVGQGRLHAVQPVRLGERFLGGVRLTFSTDRLAGLRIDHTRRTVGVALVFLALGVLVAGVLARAVTRPLIRLTEATGEVAEGRFEGQVPEDGGGEVARLATSFNAMSRRLRETTVSRDHVDQILASLGESLLVLDVDGVVRRANPATVQLLGLDEAAVLGRPFADLLATEDAAAEARRLLSAARTEGGIRDVETAYRDAGGDPVPVLLSVSAMTPATMEGAGAVCVARDIRELIRVRRSLQASETRFRQLVELAPEAIAVVSDGVVAFINPAGARLLGAESPTQVLGRILTDLMAPDARHDASQMVLAALTGEGVQPFREQTWLRLDGRPVVVEVAAVPFTLRDLPAVQLVAHDITERTRVEQMKRHFMSTVSHELRTPLTSIRGALALLASGAAEGLPARERELLQIARGNSERLQRLVNDILDLEKMSAGRMSFNPATVDLAALVEEAVGASRFYAEQLGVRLVVEAADGPMAATADPDRFAQVLTNLLSNAAKYSPAGGEVRVRVQRRHDRLRVEVSDHGPGVPEAFRESIFERFAQVDASDARPAGGTGLGLSIAKEMMERMHGGIGLDSRPGGGSTFWIELPPAESETPPTRT